jgi:hypothetical protein
MKTVLAFVFSGLLVLGAIAGNIYALHGDKYLDVASITVDVDAGADADLEKYFEERLFSFSSRLEGTPIWKVSIGKLSQEILNMDWVSEVIVKRKWPNRIEVHAKAEKIVLILMNNSGELFAVTNKGSIVPDIPSKMLPLVPLSRDHLLETDLDLRLEVVQGLMQVPRDGAFSFNNISDVHYFPTTGFEFVLRNSGQKILIGTNQILERSQRVSKVLNYLNNQGLRGRVIDARFSKKVLVRLRKAQ